jgi:hypothetical protein
MKDKENPYQQGSPDWISFEWDALCSELRSAIINIPPWNKMQLLGDNPFSVLDEVKCRMEQFRERWFPNHLER